MKLPYSLFVIAFTCQTINGQVIREYDLEKQEKHAAIKGYDASFRVNYFENIILRTTLTSDVPRIEFVNGLTNEVVDIRPATEYQLEFSADYKWFAVGFGFTPSFLLNSRSQDELNNSKSYTASLNFFYSDRLRQELKYSYFKGFFRMI